MIKGTQKSIFEYDNYREFLKDFFAFKKQEGKSLSVRNFSRLCGFQSHSFVIGVLQGKKDLSTGAIEKFVKTLKLNKDEASHFKLLVFLNQAKNSEERARYSKEIIRSRSYRKAQPLKEAQLDYFTHWYYVVIREMVKLPQFKEDPQWIASHIEPGITPKQAEEAVEQLQKLGLLNRDKTGRLIQSDSVVATADEVVSASLAHYHKEFMRKAGESIDSIPRENRDISSVTFPVSSQTAKRIKEKIQKFRMELAEEAASDSNVDTIYQLNLQLFPVTQIEEDTSEDK